MNRYLIKCINDFESDHIFSAYAESMSDECLNRAADDSAFAIAVSIVPDSFIVTTEGYEYHNMTEEAIQAVVENIEWEDYYNYEIIPYEGTDEEFAIYTLIYDGRNNEITSSSGWAEEQDSTN